MPLKAESPLDQIRWLKHTHSGLRVEEIAEQEGVSPTAIKKSIEKYERVRMVLTRDEMEAEQIGILKANAKLRQKALADALTARKIEVVMDGKGKNQIVDVGPDHDIQLRAVQTEISLISALMPKGGIKVGVAVQNNGGGKSFAAVGMDDSMEKRMTSIIEQRKALGPAPTMIEAPDVFVEGRSAEDA